MIHAPKEQSPQPRAFFCLLFSELNKPKAAARGYGETYPDPQPPAAVMDPAPKTLVGSENFNFQTKLASLTGIRSAVNC